MHELAEIALVHGFKPKSYMATAPIVSVLRDYERIYNQFSDEYDGDSEIFNYIDNHIDDLGLWFSPEDRVVTVGMRLADLATESYPLPLCFINVHSIGSIFCIPGDEEYVINRIKTHTDDLKQGVHLILSKREK